MRKHKHRPQFTKRSGNWTWLDKLPTGRRAHGLTPRTEPAPSVLLSAEKNVRDYMHSAARKRAFPNEWETARPMTGFPA